MRRDNVLKQRLRAGEAVLGTWCVLPGAGVVNVVAAAGFDFVIIDMEHGPFGFTEAEDLVRAAESEGRGALVRVPELDESCILRALETGAHGVVVPQITRADEARAAVRACKYHPEGARGLSPYTRSGGYTAAGNGDIAARENARVLVTLLVEGAAGLANLDDILAVPGVDVVYLGIYDLSQSAGRPGQVDHPDVVRAVADNVGRIRDAGVAAGCLVQNAAQVRTYAGLGVSFFAWQADCGLLYEASRAAVDAFAAEVGACAGTC